MPNHRHGGGALDTRAFETADSGASEVVKILFGYALHHTYWGEGIAAEIYLLALEYGFKELNLHRIEFMTLWNNVRMRSFFEKAGVPFEGLRRGAVLENGRPTDQAVYAVLRNEWPIVKKKLERRRDRRRSS